MLLVHQDASSKANAAAHYSKNNSLLVKNAKPYIDVGHRDQNKHPTSGRTTNEVGQTRSPTNVIYCLNRAIV